MGSPLDPRIYNHSQARAAEWLRDVSLRSHACRLHCFNKTGKHILFLVTLFMSRKKVKLLTGLGRWKRIVFKSRGKHARKILRDAALTMSREKFIRFHKVQSSVLPL